MARELNILALMKGNERYVYVYEDEARRALLETLQGQAADPKLSLNWFDVAVLRQKVDEQTGVNDELLTSDSKRFS